MVRLEMKKYNMILKAAEINHPKKKVNMTGEENLTSEEILTSD